MPSSPAYGAHSNYLLRVPGDEHSGYATATLSLYRTTTRVGAETSADYDIGPFLNASYSAGTPQKMTSSGAIVA